MNCTTSLPLFLRRIWPLDPGRIQMERDQGGARRTKRKEEDADGEREGRRGGGGGVAAVRVGDETPTVTQAR